MNTAHLRLFGTRLTAPNSARRLRAVLVVSAVVVASCAGAPAVPLGSDGQPDAVLDEGLEVFSAQCAQCHGRQGQGGRGKKLNEGSALERYPEANEMISVVADGLNAGMPAFGDKLDDGELDAVVRYVREVLN